MGEGVDGPWLLRDGRRVEEREAVACEAPAFSRLLAGFSWR